MPEPIEIELTITDPIELELQEQPVIYINNVNQGPAGPPGEGVSSWEEDEATSIKPKENKTVDGSHLSGEIAGGIFQP